MLHFEQKSKYGVEYPFNHFCIQANYRNLAKDPFTEQGDHCKSPLLEILALHSALPEKALSVLRYTIDPQISQDDKKKPWVWMAKLHTLHRQFTSPDRFKFWTTTQDPNESKQEWEVKVRQTGSLCAYGELSDELTHDKFIFGLNDDNMRTELQKT